MNASDIQSGAWISEYASSMYQLFEGQVVDGFQPLDFFSFFPLWFDLWIEKVDQALERARILGWPKEKLFNLLPVPSNLRAHLQKMIPTLDRVNNKKQAQRVIEFIVKALDTKTLMDPFGKQSNIIHGPEELSAFLETIPWKVANPEIAKELGRLITSAGSLMHGLYNDVGTDYGWDAYGPYPLPEGPGMLLIRHFTDLKPIELWPQWQGTATIPAKEILLYEIYTDIDCTIKVVGCHTTFSSTPIDHLVSVALHVDGRWIDDIGAIRALRTSLASHAQILYQHLRTMSEQELRRKVVEQECFQLNGLFRFVGMDWQPTPAMLERAQAPLLEGRYPKGRFMTFEEYCHSMGVNELRKMYGLEVAMSKQQSANTDQNPLLLDQEPMIIGPRGEFPDDTDRPSTPLTLRSGNTGDRQWLDEFLDAFANAVSNSDAAGWMPFDYHRFYPYVSNLMLDRWIEVVDRLKGRATSVWEIARTLSGPLTLRFELLFLNLFHLQATDRRQDAKAWTAIEFLNDVVRAGSTHDPYGLTGAWAHTPEQVQTFVSNTPWQQATPESRTEVTRLLSAATHLMWAYYSDYYYMNWYEIFGPYTLPGNRQMLVRAFTNFNPIEVWPSSPPHLHTSSPLCIYQIFHDTDIRLDQWSHTLATTPIGPRLEQWAVKIGEAFVSDLDPIRALRQKLEQSAVIQFDRFRSLSFEDQKIKVLELEGYGLRSLFALAGMDWRPTSAMLRSVAGKPLLPDAYPPFSNIDEARRWWRTFADPRTEENFPKEFTVRFALK